MLADYRDEVTAMSQCYEGIAIGTTRGFIHIWDNFLSRSIKTIELSSLPFKLLSFGIINLDFNQRRLLVLTIAGDCVEIQIDQSHTNKIKAKRINSITKIQRNQKAATILHQIEKTIMIAGDDGIVNSFDMATHELVDIWQVGAKITSLSSLSLEEGGFIVAAGTADGNLIIRQDWEEIIPRHHYCGHKQINDVCFSKNGALIAIASSDKHIYLFQYQDGDYVKLAACRLENGFPVALNFSEDSKKVVICTNQRKLLLLDPQSFQLMFRIEDLSQYFWSSFLGKYPLVTKTANTNMLPFALGNVSNIVGAADENGNLFIWKDVETIKENIGLNLTGHASAIQSLEFTRDDKRMITLGAQDQCVLQWRINPVEQLEGDGKPTEESAKEAQKIVLDDDSLVNELNFCYSKVQKETEVREDNGVLIRGSNNLTTNRVLSQLNFDFQETVWKRPPALSLVLDHIYGVQTSDRRHTVFYMHFFTEIEQPKTVEQSITQHLGLSGTQNARLDQILPRMLGHNFQGIIDNLQPVKYDQVHTVCQKFIVYFTSRFAIMFNPPQEQKFYQGHGCKISCIVKHPFRRLIATGEVNICPTVHVWDVQTMETVQVLETVHRGGVMHLAFSNDGTKLISIGMDRTFSIQVFQWEQNRTILFRNLGYMPVFGVKFDPYDHNKFITCGYEHMSCWRITGSHLSCQQFQNYKSSKLSKNQEESKTNPKQAPKTLRSTLMSIDYLSYKLGHSIQSDAIFGTSQGEILTFCSGRLLVLNETAHESAINVVKVCDQLTRAEANVITGGEDGLIKVWDSAINLLQVIDTRAAQILKDLKNPRSYGVQSLDLYCCDKKNPRRLLIGQRCGEILEAVITEEQGRAEELMMQLKINKALGEGLSAAQRHVPIKFDFFSYISAHSSLHMSQNQKKVFVAMYPLYPIMATVGDDEALRFWDIHKKHMILSKNLGTQATSLVFSPDGSYLIIGLVNGVMLVLESKFDKLNFGTYLEEYTLPTLEVLISPKEAKASIVCMKFSYKGDYLAVSFNNEYTEEQVQAEQNRNRGGAQEENKMLQDMGSREPSFVLLFINRHSMQNPGIGLNKKDPYVKLGKITLPLADYQASMYIRSLLAVTHIDFSENDAFLEFCVQRVNAEGVKYHNNIQFADDGSNVKDIIVVWNIKQGKVVSDFDTIRDVNWPDWSIAPSINARKKGTELFIDDIQEERKLLYNELVYMSAVQRFGLLDNAICGSQDGVLILFRFLALTIERLKVQDFSFDFVRKREMAATKSYSAHTSMINNIEIFEDKFVMSTSVLDQSIVQWRVEYEDQHWDLDFNSFVKDINDPFAEVPNQLRFQKLVNEVWSLRLQVAEINQGIDKEEFANPACEMQLEHVIGRRAYDRRNNLKVDCMERICYQAGSLQVFMQDNDESIIKQSGDSRIKQTFLRPEKNKFTAISPELSHFCMSADLRMIFIATSQITSCIYIWELTTNQQLGKLELPNCPVILTIKVASDNQHILIVVSTAKFFLTLMKGLTKDYDQCIMLLNWKTQKLLGVHLFLHSLPFKIKDIDFVPGSTRKFVTAGIQHMCFWQLTGNHLIYQVGELTIPKVFRNIGGGASAQSKSNQPKFGMALVADEYHQQLYAKPTVEDSDLDNIFVSFLVICFLRDTLITSGDDGYLYLWEGERIIRRVVANESSVFALSSNPKLGLLVSGGLEGIVVLWRLLVESKSSIKSLERLKVFNMRKSLDPSQAISNPEYNIQSLCIGYNRIIIGMRSGSILEVKIADEQSQGAGQKQMKVKQWQKCTDHEIPKCVGIDIVSSRIFTLTAQGLFTVWDLLTFDIIYQKNFHKETRSMQALRLSNNILLVFEHEIKMLDSNPKSNNFQEMTEYSMNLNAITYATLNHNEKLLGVATTSAARPEITLYSTANGFMKLTQIFGFKSSIRYLDFSTDNYYLQIEDNVGEITLYEIETERPIQTDAIDFELEWLGEGLRTYQKVKGVHHQFSANNKIIKIRKILGKPIIIIGDQIGTIRLFNYPNITGQPYYQCFPEHLYQISDCVFSPDRTFFVSTCEMDRCVFKWKITYNEEKILLLTSKEKFQ